MRTLYDFILYLYHSLIGLSAFLGNPKAKLWIQGRKNWEEKIATVLSNAGKKRIWFHCASVGEFEQGRSLIEKIKVNDPSVFIVLSFFSPSGYELRKNFQAADLGLFTSETESFCLSILEAMCFGCPSVATRVGGIPEVIENDLTGLLVPFGDVDALARAVESLIRNPARRMSLGKAAQQRAREHFSPEAIVPKYEALYHRVCG